ncbi:hypothetical protein K2173_027919 [Erythroxylum novogranatense]|uniref:DNA 5'-3' helicase FANCJ n=1 Tax=Erythroxylum novogranatense TaxID=1862640 RepID=A0AAV8U0H0_9ROSI|nr:hypothetical protein K2173_027919 [Erythroxylum novogranatense]
MKGTFLGSSRKNRVDMVSATPVTTASPSPKPKNVYHVGGVQVEFPYQPYGTQLAFMGRVISTLDRALRDGHCHALLESPTGTGKSLSLLCSTLAWQQNYKLKKQQADQAQSKPDPEAMTDPLGHGGGFIPETQPSRKLPSSVTEPAQPASNNKNQKKSIVPTIFYSSRTHSQLSQVIREYKKTAYRVPMTVLASRKHYCTNNHVNGKENLDEECKLLLKDQECGCSHFKNAHKVKGHPSLQKGGCHEVHDIEDLVKIGKVVKGCPYYAARSMADDAQLTFCPYNYIINPVIRGAMEVDIRGAVLVLDEAHNIEDIARDAGSVDIEEDVLHKLQTELQQLCGVDAIIYQPLCEMIQDLSSWIERRKDTLEKRELQHYVSCWTGEKALKELQEANISPQCFPILLECATKAIKTSTDTESDVPGLSGMAVMTLEGLFSALTYFFSRNGAHISDYQLALQRNVKIDRSAGHLPGWTHILSLWCMNPAVVFNDIANLSLSVILTSGTLSPMNSFSSELGVHFGTSLEAPHVIDAESQVWAAVISTSPDNYPLNASYKTADAYAFQDALGKSLEEICKVVPAGSLLFFPSYKLMEKLLNRWRETGQWSRLNARKSLFIEPRGGSQEDFDCILKDYYVVISGRSTTAGTRKRKVKKIGMKNLQEDESAESFKNEGAAFLAVCRGKVSEGIDFSDDNARVVIVVGIPFPNINDIQVGLKKKYNDTYKSSKNLLSGSDWYCNQAFRAINQAAGRCIRHRFDYGAIILLDERYQEERNRVNISKWLRKSIRHYENFDMSMEGLKTFFRDAKENVVKNVMNASESSDVNMETCTTPNGKSKRSKRPTSKKLQNSDQSMKVVSSSKYDVTTEELEFKADVHAQASAQGGENSNSCKEFIDLDHDSQTDTGCIETYYPEDAEVTLVKETPGIDGPEALHSPASFSNGGISSSTVVQASNDLTYASLNSPSFTSQRRATYSSLKSMEVSPDKQFTVNPCSLGPDVESSLNLSVNSQIQKRRTYMGLQLLTDEEISDVPIISSFECASSTRNSVFTNDKKGPEYQSAILNGPQLLPVDDCNVSCLSSNNSEDKMLQISCALCKNRLGIPEKHFNVMCSVTSSSKVHLLSVVKKRLDHWNTNASTQLPVLITDISWVDQRLLNRSSGDDSGKGIWCEEDGCVFKSIFCPFCSNSNCIGVQILATDASNVHLLNKILFYLQCLQIQSHDASKDMATKDDETTRLGRGIAVREKVPILNRFERFSYSPELNSGGWRTTKPKPIPKRGLVSSVQGSPITRTLK